MPVSKEEFRRALGCLASGVTVVTLRRDAGELGGITVTAFSSLSLDPPLVLICIDRRARLHDDFQRGAAFAVNLLAADQELLSHRFASRHEQPFSDIAHGFGRLGSPLLSGAIASIECTIVDLLPGGDHTIVVGAVEQTTVGAAQSAAGAPGESAGAGGSSTAGAKQRPLLYFRGRYARLA